MIHTSAVIEGRRVTIGYLEGKRETDLFTDMDFTLYRGELTALLGTNGTGKSTLLRTMSATQPYLRGNILLNGRELSSYNERELARHIGVVFTERYMAGGLRVHELVALGRYPYTGFFGRLDENDRLITRNFPTEKDKKPSSPKRWHRKAMSYYSTSLPRFSTFPAVSKPCRCYIAWPKKTGKQFLCRHTM